MSKRSLDEFIEEEEEEEDKLLTAADLQLQIVTEQRRTKNKIRLQTWLSI